MIAGVDVTGFKPNCSYDRAGNIILYGFTVRSNDVECLCAMDSEGKEDFLFREKTADGIYNEFEIGSIHPQAIYQKVLPNDRTNSSYGTAQNLGLNWQNGEIHILCNKCLRNGLSEIVNTRSFRVTYEDKDIIKKELDKYKDMKLDKDNQKLKEEIQGYIDAMSSAELAELRDRLSTHTDLLTDAAQNTNAVNKLVETINKAGKNIEEASTSSAEFDDMLESNIKSSDKTQTTSVVK